MKNEEDIDGGVAVKWRGKIYTTGNRRHELVELCAGSPRKFVRTVRISEIRKA